MHLESKQDCVDAQQPPPLELGDTLDAGRFFRNLKKRELSRVYSNARDYGFRLKTKELRKWTDVSAQRGLSVNLVDCVCTAACSILIASDSDRIYHVWEIDLEALSSHFGLSDDCWVAVYEPRKDNICHFELWTLNGTLNSLQIVLLLATLERAFPPDGKNPPKGKQPPPGMEKAAEMAAARYGKLVKIHHDPLEKLKNDS